MSTTTLAIETATEACSVALAIDTETRQALVVEPRGHLQQVPGMIAALLAEAELSRTAIERVLVSRGPGSFTGVRIGIGYAQGIALGLGVPLIGISTLECLARGAVRRGAIGRTLVAIDARMGEVYQACFDLGRSPSEPLVRLSDDTLSDPAVIRLDPAGVWAAIGTGAVAYRDQLSRDPELPLAVEETASLPEARDLIEILAVREHLDGDPAAEICPVYLRDEVVSRP
jgi:tRNA threonylcarbamoyladenosine biosynthesis protein TsaB